MAYLARAVNEQWQQPLHWYNPGRMQAAGSYLDSGRSPKNFTTGSATLTLTNGGWGCSFNGTSEYLAASSVADWFFMQTGPFTMGGVVYTGTIQPGTWGGAGTAGVFGLAWGSTGTDLAIQTTSGTLLYRCGASGCNVAGKQVVVFRVAPPTRTSVSPSTGFDTGAAYVNGLRVGHRAAGTWTAGAVNPAIPFQVGKNLSTNAFVAGGFLDLFVDDREWGEDEIQAYTNYWKWKLDQI